MPLLRCAASHDVPSTVGLTARDCPSIAFQALEFAPSFASAKPTSTAGSASTATTPARPTTPEPFTWKGAASFDAQGLVPCSDMARLLDKIVVVDVESTCWEGDPPSGQMSEIIQVGICTVDAKSLDRGEKRSILIKPVRCSVVSEFCRALTGLTQDMLVTAGTLADAAAILKKDYLVKDRLWASWGDYDRRQFERVCKESSVAYPFGISHLNVKTLFAVSMGLDREMGMDEAYRHLGWTLEGVHHHGDDDAWNIAGVLGMLLKRARG